MSKVQGFSVRIFIPTGDPAGLRLVEKSNWTGQGLIFPRSQLVEARQRPDLKRAGVYVLWGPSESGQLPRVYVGESEVVLQRLDQHANQTDFWTHAVVFTSKDHNLNKAHVQYLEARLVALAAKAKRAELDNGNELQLPNLSEPDRAYADAFLEDLLLCLPLMGVSFFELPKVEKADNFDLFLRAKRVILARGVETAGGFVVFAGSQAIKREKPSSLRELRESLLKLGVLKDNGETYILTQDYVFTSPSAAASFVLDRSSNGRVEWKDATGRTLKELQEVKTT